MTHQPPSPRRVPAAAPTDSHDEIERLNRYYADYHANSEWARDTPGNRAIHDERDRAVQRLAQRLGPRLADATILDLGCGSGTLLAQFVSWGATPSRLAGIDLMEDRIADARRRLPAVRFDVVNAERLPFEDAAFDVVSTFTVFSSLLDHTMAARVAGEVHRVLKPGGAVLWYDLRVGNPRNPNVRGLALADVRTLFPRYDVQFQTVTLVPPLARRLGPLTPVLYPVLAAVPFLRTHYLGTLRKPTA